MGLAVATSLASWAPPAAAAEPQWVITSGKPIALYAESHALLIGISDYDNGWPKLRGVLDDIKAVEAALTQTGFATEVVVDPDRVGIDRAITRFIARFGGQPDNRLLVYYAGHGHTLKASYGGEMGYIVPRDAPDPNLDRSGFMGAAISMQTIEVYARQIEAKHALFVFDSCFSGSVFHPTRAIPDVVQDKSAYPVRQFITSGAADQAVPDYSTFRRAFVSAITGDAGVGKDGYLTGSQLGSYLEEKVTNYSKRTQTPQYGKLQDPNLDRGDFIFILPAGATPAPPPAPAADAEIVFWQTIANSSNPADFAEYLRQYPNGRFAGLARTRLQLPPPAAPASVAVASVPPSSALDQARQAETALALSLGDRQAIQRWLTALGHDTGGTDGQFGAQTRKAIAAYQTATAAPETGYLTADQVKALSEAGKASLARASRVSKPVEAPAADGKSPAPTLAASVAPRSATSPRCGEILQTLQMGEAVSDADRALLRTECGRP